MIDIDWSTLNRPNVDTQFRIYSIICSAAREFQSPRFRKPVNLVRIIDPIKIEFLDFEEIHLPEQDLIFETCGDHRYDEETGIHYVKINKEEINIEKDLLLTSFHEFSHAYDWITSQLRFPSKLFNPLTEMRAYSREMELALTLNPRLWKTLEERTKELEWIERRKRYYEKLLKAYSFRSN